MFVERCPWYIAGPILGGLIVAIRVTVNKPLGALGGYIDVANHLAHPSRLGFSTFVLIGTAIGGALFATVTGAHSPDAVYSGVLASATGLRFVILAVAGLAMGFGARTAGGCTSGHGLTGTSVGSPASIVAAMTFFATAVALAHILTWLAGGVS
jgi:uncharacterized membrane protein YedE/YeeE